jgi:hypothetical protein
MLRRMTTLKIILITAALTMALAVPANANDDAILTALAAGTPATDGAIYAALPAADAHWGGPPSCGQPTIRMYDEPRSRTHPIARGDFNACNVWIDRKWFRGIRNGMRYGDRGAWQLLCVILAHERGHNRGLQHESHGVMEPDPRYNASRACNSWARDQYRRYVRH